MSNLIFKFFRITIFFPLCLFTATVSADIEPFYPINDSWPPAFVSEDLSSARDFMDLYLSEELRGASNWRSRANNFLSLTEVAQMTGKQVRESISRSYKVKKFDGVAECYGMQYATSCYFEMGFRIVRRYEIESVKYVNECRNQVEVVVIFDEVGYTDRLSEEKERAYIEDKKSNLRVSYFLEHRENEDIDADDRESRMGWYFTNKNDHRLSCEAVLTYHELEIKRLRRVIEAKSGDVKQQIQKWLDKYVADSVKIKRFCNQDK